MTEPSSADNLFFDPLPPETAESDHAARRDGDSTHDGPPRADSASTTLGAANREGDPRLGAPRGGAAAQGAARGLVAGPSTAAENSAAGKTSPGKRADGLAFHTTWLVIALATLALAGCLRAPGEDKVFLPFFAVPLPELCFTRRATGWNCPGCGLTRAFICLMHGEWERAWRFNPAAPLVMLALAAQIPFRAWQIRRVLRGQAGWPERRVEWLLWIAAAGLFLQWGVRLGLQLCHGELAWPEPRALFPWQ